MAKKTIIVEVIYKYELEVDTDNQIVKEYNSETEMLIDCATYRFGTGLPVINDGGVTVKDVELLEVN